MVKIFPTPTRVPAAGTPPKRIDEHVGLASTGSRAVSVAIMHSPAGWSEPAQVPEFDEWTIVLRGELHVEADDGTAVATAGHTVHAPAGTRVRYGTPNEATEYISVCLPAFSPATVHRIDA
jgi:ethanolamine utilization protein EutQ (cupin superfamily)